MYAFFLCVCVYNVEILDCKTRPKWGFDIAGRSGNLVTNNWSAFSWANGNITGVYFYNLPNYFFSRVATSASIIFRCNLPRLFNASRTPRYIQLKWMIIQFSTFTYWTMWSLFKPLWRKVFAEVYDNNQKLITSMTMHIIKRRSCARVWSPEAGPLQDNCLWYRYSDWNYAAFQRTIWYF